MTDPSQPNWGPSTHGAIRHHEGEGWVLFAGIMIIILGVLNVIWGLAAIDDSKFFVANAQYVISDLNTWGWFMVVLGAVQFLSAFGIWMGNQAGRWVGILSAGANAVLQMLAIPAAPFLSLTLFTVDILVLYGLIAYGGRRK